MKKGMLKEKILSIEKKLRESNGKVTENIALLLNFLNSSVIQKLSDETDISYQDFWNFVVEQNKQQAVGDQDECADLLAIWRAEEKRLFSSRNLELNEVRQLHAKRYCNEQLKQLDVLLDSLRNLLNSLDSQLKKNPFPDVKEVEEIYEDVGKYEVYFTATNELNAFIKKQFNPEHQFLLQTLQSSDLYPYFENLLKNLGDNIPNEKQVQIKVLQGNISALFIAIKAFTDASDYVLQYVNARGFERRECDSIIIQSVRNILNSWKKCFKSLYKNVGQNNSPETEKKIKAEKEEEPQDKRPVSELHSSILRMPQEILLSIFVFLSRRDLLSVQVCTYWQRVANDDSLWKIPKLGIANKQGFLSQFKTLSPLGSKTVKEKEDNLNKIFKFRNKLRYFLGDELQKNQKINYLLVICAFGLSTPKKISKNIESLLISKEGIVALFQRLFNYKQFQEYDTKINYQCQTLLTKNGLTALREKLITLEQAMEVHDLASLLSDSGLLALREGLITPQQAREANQLGVDHYNKRSSLYFLLTENGLRALREKLITPEQAGETYGLDFLFSDEGLEALREGLITDSIRKTPGFLCKHGLIALREKLITSEQIAKIPPYGSYWPFKFLLSDNGIRALRKKLITFDEAINNNLYLDSLLSDCGLQMLEEGLITPEVIHEILKKHSKVTGLGFCSLKSLFIANGLIALREKLITPEQAADVSDLSSLLSDRGLQALKEHLITPEQAKKFYHSGSSKGPFNNLQILLTENGLTALREKLITPEQAADVPDLSSLLSDTGLQALKEHLITPEQAKKFYRSGSFKGPYNNLRHLLTQNGLTALREGLITPEDAAYISDLSHHLSDLEEFRREKQEKVESESHSMNF